MLVTYPEEGHAGIRKVPAVFDCAARIVQWVQAFSSSADVENRDSNPPGFP
jgi:hypothetical protein